MAYDNYYTNGTRDQSKSFEISQLMPVRSPLTSPNCRPIPGPFPAARPVTNTAVEFSVRPPSVVLTVQIPHAPPHQPVPKPVFVGGDQRQEALSDFAQLLVHPPGNGACMWLVAFIEGCFGDGIGFPRFQAMCGLEKETTVFTPGLCYRMVWSIGLKSSPVERYSFEPRGTDLIHLSISLKSVSGALGKNLLTTW